MKNSGYALMGCGTGMGENRIEDAVKGALESPLLMDYDLTTAKNFIINITVGNNEQGLTGTGYGRVNDLIKAHIGKANNFKTGLVFSNDQDFGDKVNITVIVTGIDMSILPLHDQENLIVIESDFTYDSNSFHKEYNEVNEHRNEKIGYNNASLRKKNLFRDGAPALIVNERNNISYLENTAAIRRKTKDGKNEN